MYTELVATFEDFQKQIGPFTSEFLTLGVSDENGHCVLVSPDLPAGRQGVNVPLGGKLF